MLIKEKPLQHWIDHFYGYGSWNAKIWFVSYEEGGGDLPEDVADRLNYFYKNHNASNDPTLCDIRELYKQVTARVDGPKSGVFETLYDYRFGPNAIQHGAWKNLITFLHAFNNKKLPDLLKYQKASFANNDVALINLYPLPSPHNHAWYYSWLDMPAFSFLKSRKMYEDHVYESRTQGLLKMIKDHKPQIVVMYGMSNINDLKNSFGSKFKIIKGTGQVIPQHHRTEIDRTTVIITTQIPTLRHGRPGTGFDWYEFGKSIRDTKGSAG
ncbi:MAG: hypothetical protein WDO14_23115 [Bacteroidota bacterium]